MGHRKFAQQEGSRATTRSLAQKQSHRLQPTYAETSGQSLLSEGDSEVSRTDGDSTYSPSPQAETGRSINLGLIRPESVTVITAATPGFSGGMAPAGSTTAATADNESQLEDQRLASFDHEHNSLEAALAFIYNPPQNLCVPVAVKDADDWSDVKDQKIEELTDRLYFALSVRGDEAPTDWKQEDQDFYNKSIERGVNNIEVRVETAHQQSLAKARCRVVIEQVVIIHEKGVPEFAAERQGKKGRPWKKVEGNMTCSQRANKIIKLVRKSKRIAVDVLDGKTDELVRSPDAYFANKLSNSRGNAGKAGVLKKDTAERKNQTKAHVAAEGSRAESEDMEVGPPKNHPQKKRPQKPAKTQAASDDAMRNINTTPGPEPQYSDGDSQVPRSNTVPGTDDDAGFPSNPVTAGQMCPNRADVAQSQSRGGRSQNHAQRLMKRNADGQPSGKAQVPRKQPKLAPAEAPSRLMDPMDSSMESFIMQQPLQGNQHTINALAMNPALRHGMDLLPPPDAGHWATGTTSTQAPRPSRAETTMHPSVNNNNNFDFSSIYGQDSIPMHDPRFTARGYQTWPPKTTISEQQQVAPGAHISGDSHGLPTNSNNGASDAGDIDNTPDYTIDRARDLGQHYNLNFVLGNAPGYTPNYMGGMPSMTTDPSMTNVSAQQLQAVNNPYINNTASGFASGLRNGASNYDDSFHNLSAEEMNQLCRDIAYHSNDQK